MTDEQNPSATENQEGAKGGEEQKEQQQEKMLKQSEVDKLAYAKKMEGYERGKRDALAEIEANKVEIPVAEAGANNSNVAAGVTPEQIQLMIEQEAEKRTQQQMAQQVVQTFVGKMRDGVGKHEDFETVVGKLDIPNMPPSVVHWAASIDNTADVMYELAKNPSKYANLLTLSVTAPELARDELARLSSSIKKNEEAAKSHASGAPEPLSQMKPSTNGTDNGNMSVSELRKQDWLRD